MKPHVALVVLIVAVSWVGEAHAWNPLDPERPIWIGTVPYALHSAGSADLGGFAPTETILRQAMNDWESVSCSSLRGDYRGRTNMPPGQGQSYVIGWVESGWPDTSPVIGATMTVWRDGHIHDSSMLLNGDRFTWSAEPRAGAVHAYSILLHELGHYIGLDHSAAGTAMQERYPGGALSIGEDERAGICSLYPASDDPSDCTSRACPTEYECVEGTCVWAPLGDGTQCAPCRIDDDCNGLGRCINYPDSDVHGYCGDSCSTASDCGMDQCELIGARSFCVRLWPDAPPDCRVERGPGTDPPLADAGTMMPDAGVPSSSDAGPIVEVPTVSDGGVVETAADGGAMDSVPMGETCVGNDDCTTGMCVSESGSALGVCTDTCDDDAACPEGFGCREGGYCAPVAGNAPVDSSDTHLSGGCTVSPSHTGMRFPMALLLLFPVCILANRMQRS